MVKPQAKKKAADQEEESWYRPGYASPPMPPPQAASWVSAEGALRSTSLKVNERPSVGATGKSSDSLMLMFQPGSPTSPLWAHSWLSASCCLYQVYYFPFASFYLSLYLYHLYTYLYHRVELPLEQVGDLISLALPFAGRVALEGVWTHRRQMPLGPDILGTPDPLRSQVVPYSYGDTEHSLQSQT